MKKKSLPVLLATAAALAAVCIIAQFNAPDTAPSSVSSASGAASSNEVTAPSSQEAQASSAPSELTRAAMSVIDFFVEGETESVPATLYVGKGYSIYVPSEGWTVTEGDGSTTWISDDNETVGFSVSTFAGVSAAEARAAYIADSGFEFEDLNGGKLGDPLLGWNEDGDALGLVSAEKDGTVYIVAWTYPEEAIEGFGARLQQIADTFEVM